MENVIIDYNEFYSMLRVFIDWCFKCCYWRTYPTTTL